MEPFICMKMDVVNVKLYYKMQYCYVKMAWKYMPNSYKVCTYMKSPLYNMLWEFAYVTSLLYEMFWSYGRTIKLS